MIWQCSNLDLKMSAGRHFGNILGINTGINAEKIEENFAFEIEFLLKLSDQLSEKSKIPSVNFLSRQNLIFVEKKRFFQFLKFY